MTIEVKERTNKEYYDEFLYVISNYKKIIKNPNHKVSRLSLSAINMGLISLVVFTIFIVLFILDNGFKPYIYVIYVFGFLIILSIIYYILIRIKINELKSIRGAIIFNINKEHIEYLSEVGNYELKWEDVKYIIINKYSICFVPIVVGKPLMSLNMEYKDNVYKVIKEFDKDELLIDNSNLYR